MKLIHTKMFMFLLTSLLHFLTKGLERTTQAKRVIVRHGCFRSCWRWWWLGRGETSWDLEAFCISLTSPDQANLLSIVFISKYLPCYPVLITMKNGKVN